LQKWRDLARLACPTEAVRRREAEPKRQTTKGLEKMSARTLFWPEAGFLNFY